MGGGGITVPVPRNLPVSVRSARRPNRCALVADLMGFTRKLQKEGEHARRRASVLGSVMRCHVFWNRLHPYSSAVYCVLTCASSLLANIMSLSFSCVFLSCGDFSPVLFPWLSFPSFEFPLFGHCTGLYSSSIPTRCLHDNSL